MSAAETLEITLGVGRRSSRGMRVTIPAARLADTLAAHAPGRAEAWWSVHVWEGDHRGKERWQAASGICLDIDHEVDGVHCAPPPETRAQMDDAVQALPGSLFHHTPRGARVIFVLDALCRDQSLYLRACEGAVRLVSRAIAHIPSYKIDRKASCDLARLMWAPTTTVDGQAREAEIVRLRRDTYSVEELAQHAEPEPVQASQHTPREASPIAEASERWLRDHPQEWGTHQPCPACEGKDSFSGLPGSHRWVCHHSSHRAPGRPSDDGACYTGDALDLEAWRRGCTVVEVLRQDGYIAMAPVRAAPRQAEVVDLAEYRGPGEITKSFASLCAILRHDRRIIPEELAWDELAQAPTIGGVQITDTTALAIREKIELTITDSKGKGLTFSKEEVDQAIDLVASERPYNPVVEYLSGLQWDGVERLDHVPDDYLGADDNPLYRVLFRKWAISAVARALSPGCQVDTVLILQGGQGARKSSFFTELVGVEWFTSAKLSIDKDDRDAALALSRVWVLEWGELESLQRAKDQDAIKEFITRRIDTIRMPYGKRMVRLRRHSVIVGTTNDDDFLADPTGARRYWIIPVEEINLEPIPTVRDQLWAEAVHRYREGEIWHLTRDEEDQLAEIHARFQRRDPWEEQVIEWMERQAGPRSTADILSMAVDKPAGQWTTADARRIAAIMRRAGYRQRKGHRSRVWVKEGT